MKDIVATPLPTAFGGLSGLKAKLAGLETELADMGVTKDRKTSVAVRKLRKLIREFEPSITMIGQVKAGKTTLVNAMAGWPELLPADINPWTSVVTALHMQPQMAQEARRASFRFFTNEEWDHLIRQGGRVGEMANRAGAADELEKVRRQLDEMRAKSQARLGRRFQMLLGQSHDYDCFDETLIQRYVCMGDDFWEDAGGTQDQGRFADITKSADLWFARPDLPVNLCIQDTPGVNDTFMIREQITINALRGSRLCVMVLSAQQALSSVDLGLIRLIANVQARDVIIFVNRIDELADPGTAVPEIRASIQQTLRKFDGPADAEIIFGSGHWAMHAAGGTFNQLGEDSADTLLSWAETQLDDAHAGLAPQEVIWHLSGLPKLGQAIAERIDAGVGAKLLERAENGVANLRASFSVAAMVADPAQGALGQCRLDRSEITSRFQTIQDHSSAALDHALAQAQNTFMARVEKAHHTFLGRATSSLVQHLERYGEDEIWTYDPAGLRMLLRSSFQVFVRSATKASGGVFDIAAEQINDIYRAAFDIAPGTSVISAPPLPPASPPVVLGQTIALDMRGGWWNRFWRKRRGYQAFFDDFSKLIHEETLPIVTALRQQNADEFTKRLRADLDEFVTTQSEVLIGMTDDLAANPGAYAAPEPGAPTDANDLHSAFPGTT